MRKFDRGYTKRAPFRGRRRLALKQAREHRDNGGKHDGNDGKELDENVQCGTGSILEGVSDGIADDSGFVAGRTFAAVLTALDILFRVIPSAAGVGHHDREHKTGGGRPEEHARNPRDPERESHENGRDERNAGGKNHLLQRGLRTEIDTTRIIRFRLPFHESGNGLKLSAHLENNALCSPPDRAHGERGEQEGQHAPEEEPDEHGGIHDREIEVGHLVLYEHHKARQKRERGQRGGTDGKPFARRGCGVSERIERIGAFADALVHAGHLRDTARIVRDRTVGVRRKRNSERGEHSDRRDAYAEQPHFGAVKPRRNEIAANEERDDDGDGDDDDGQERREHAEGKSRNNGRRAPRLRAVRKFFGGAVVVRSEIFGKESDRDAREQSAEHGDTQKPAIRAQPHNPGDGARRRNAARDIGAPPERG